MGGGKRADSLRVEMAQNGRPLLFATIWTVADGSHGYEHDFASAPEVPRPEALRGYQDLADNYAEWYPIWRSIEGRPQRWNEPPGKPEWRAWMRFNDSAIPDRQSDALRQLFWLDFPGWNATIAAHSWPFKFLAPNLDLTVQFIASHRRTRGASSTASRSWPRTVWSGASRGCGARTAACWPPELRNTSAGRIRATKRICSALASWA
jgi:acyl-CoA thioesterase